MSDDETTFRVSSLGFRVWGAATTATTEEAALSPPSR